MSPKLIQLGSFLCAVALAGTALCFESSASVVSSSQNANSSTTAPEENMNQTPRRGRRGRRSAMPVAENTNMPAPDATEDTTEQTDLSGTYTGTFECADAGVTGETTLTITGNTFTLADGKSGRISAATTRGYTGVAMQFGDVTMATANSPGSAPVIVSMRARKSGNRLTLTTVPNAGRVCSFTPAR